MPPYNGADKLGGRLAGSLAHQVVQGHLECTHGIVADELEGAASEKALRIIGRTIAQSDQPLIGMHPADRSEPGIAY